jgi:hypothetical protein
MYLSFRCHPVFIVYSEHHFHFCCHRNCQEVSNPFVGAVVLFKLAHNNDLLSAIWRIFSLKILEFVIIL